MNNPIMETVLWKSVSPHIKSITSNQLLYNLATVGKKAVVDWHQDNLDSAMSWVRTSQGQAFWSILHDEYHRNLPRN